MRILHIEDDPFVARDVRRLMESNGFLIDSRNTGQEGFDLASVLPYDLIILKLGLPELAGSEIVSRLRETGNTVPIIVLDPDEDPETKIQLLDQGADDYVVRPFHDNELIARARAVIRRSYGKSSSVISVGTLTIDLIAGEAFSKGERMLLQPKEYQLLEMIVSTFPEILMAEEACKKLFGNRSKPRDNSMRVYVSKIRRELRAVKEDGVRIENIRGKGYLLRLR